MRSQFKKGKYIPCEYKLILLSMLVNWNFSMQSSKSFEFVYGIHAVMTLLQQTPKTVQTIYILEGRHDQRLQNLIRTAERQRILIQSMQRQELDALASGNQHQGIIAAVAESDSKLETDLNRILENLSQPAFLLILDGVQDPHNLGACLRSANAAGVHAVIAPKDRAVGITPVVRKVASGAAELTPFIQVTNLARTMRDLQEQGVWLYGLAEEGDVNLYDVDLTGPVALVLGAEGSGLRRLTREHCDQLLKIPTVGTISSLNVSVAAGICLFEAARQRLKIQK